MLLLISETYHMLSENSVRQNILDYGPFVIGDWVLGTVWIFRHCVQESRKTTQWICS